MFRDRDLPLRLAAALLPPRLAYALTRALTPVLGAVRHRRVARAVEAAAADLLGDESAGARAGRGFAASIACDDLDAITGWLWPRALRLRSITVEGASELPEPGRAVFVSFHLGGGFRIFDVLAARGFRPAVIAVPPPRTGNLYDRLLAHARRIYWQRELGEGFLLVGPSVAREALRSPAPHLASGGAVIALLDVAPAVLGLRDAIEVSLLGRRLEIPAGILRLAAGSGVPVIPFDGRIEGGRRILRLHAPIRSRDPEIVSARAVAVLEGVIRERPWDWQGWLDAHRLLGDPVRATAEHRSVAPSEPIVASEPIVTNEAIVTNEPSRGLDVVVPVFNARADVARCLESVLAHSTSDSRVIVVDDASSEPGLATWLDDLATREPRVVVLRNPTNQGFVRSANRGMREAAGRDVVLLNSDTIVPQHFLERLREAARATAATGIVSPFTNNGTVCSVPEFMRDNPLPDGLDTKAFDALVAATSLRRRPELLTAHGFCMYVRAEVIERVGLFDEASFGRGYGEENDFCERAKAAGFAVRLCDDLFVHHRGEASFGDTGDALRRSNLEVLGRLHPGYHERVQRFIRENPLADVQANVRYQLARREARRHPAMLFLLHADPFVDPERENIGGTQYHVLDLVRSLALPRAIIAFPTHSATETCAVEIEGGDIAHPRRHHFPRPVGNARDPSAERFLLRDPALESAVGELLGAFDVAAAHIHHLAWWPIGLWRTLAAHGVPYAYTIQDYYCVCPSWNLLDLSTLERCACGDAAGADRRRCLTAWYTAAGLAAPSEPEALLRDHRAELGELLANARAVIAPCRATREIVARAFTGRELRWHLIPYGYDSTPPARPPRREGPLRVALLGAVAAPWKGAEQVLDVMARTRELPLEWHAFGDADGFGFPARAREALGDPASARFHVHGRYRREGIEALLAQHAIDASLLLSPWDETFCYTLSESWGAGVPAIVSNRGALAERTRATGAGLVASSSADAAERLARLAREPRLLEELTRAALERREPTLVENAAQHRVAYGDMLARLAPRMAPPPFGGSDRALFVAHWRAVKRTE